MAKNNELLAFKTLSWWHGPLTREAQGHPLCDLAAHSQSNSFRGVDQPCLRHRSVLCRRNDEGRGTEGSRCPEAALRHPSK